jgi:hypothetical protein
VFKKIFLSIAIITSIGGTLISMPEEPAPELAWYQKSPKNPLLAKILASSTGFYCVVVVPIVIGGSLIAGCIKSKGL